MRHLRKITYKENWMCDLDSDVARSSKDTNVSNQNPKKTITKYDETRVWIRIQNALRVDTYTCWRKSNKYGETRNGGSTRATQHWFQSTKTDCHMQLWMKQNISEFKS